MALTFRWSYFREFGAVCEIIAMRLPTKKQSCEHPKALRHTLAIQLRERNERYFKL